VTISRGIELAVALALFVAGVFFYRRGSGTDGYGSQGAVILFAIAAIIAIHALGLLEYRPSPADADFIQRPVQ
jgi:hypothetical protein